MKRLIENESAKYSSETVEWNGMKFKIYSANDNSYCRIDISVYTSNGDLANIATFGDVPNVVYVKYYDEDGRRIILNKRNLLACEEYIKKVYPKK